MAENPDQIHQRLLILRCVNGDEIAFGSLIELHGRQLSYYVRKLVGEESLVDDILQEIWLDVYRGLPKLREPAAFAAWLYRIARNRVYGELRRRRRYEPLDEADTESHAEDNGELSTVEAERIHHALDSLAIEHREVLVLRFVERMTYEQISEAIGRPLGTVRSRIHYAKRSLRRTLNQENEDVGRSKPERT